MTRSIEAVCSSNEIVAPAAGGRLLDGAALAIVERLILSTDATVVRLLEACFGERIRTAGLAQNSTRPLASDVDLELAGDETVLRRATLLQGCLTGRHYVYAESSVVLDRLAESVREALISTSEPIGRVLIDQRVESFREMLSTGRAPAGPPGASLGVRDSDLLVFRTYRVIVGRRPVMLITEYFAPSFLPHRARTQPANAAPLAHGR